MIRRAITVFAALAAFCFICGSADAQQTGRRIALVIGNSSYRNVERLPNPDNDARLIAKTLEAAGFTLVGGGPQLDLDKPHFDRIVQQFGRALPGADVALFYYSGHGMQVDGVNWLVPVDANPGTPKDLDFQMVDASLVLRQMEDAGTKLNLVILDACRNNPFAVRGIRGTAGGLAEMRAPEGTLISYATQPGNVAADGAGGDSPYTTALVDAIRTPGLDVFRVFNQVGLTVKQQTAGSQQPWLASSPIAGNFFFFNQGPVNITLAPPPPTAVPSAPQPASANRRFDGDWAVTVSCERTADALGYHWTFPATVSDGHLRGVHGVPGAPAYFTLDGAITEDGTAHLYGAGLTGRQPYNVNGVAQGQPFEYMVEDAHFSPTHGAGRRTHVRPCTLDFAKQHNQASIVPARTGNGRLSRTMVRFR